MSAGAGKVGAAMGEELARVRKERDELLEALQALGVHPVHGYCFCLNREQQEAGHTGECREARTAIRNSEGDDKI